MGAFDKFRLTPKRKVVDKDGTTIKLIQHIKALSLPELYGGWGVSFAGVETKKAMRLIPRRKLIGADGDIQPIINLIQHIQQTQIPDINWAGGGVVENTETAITASVALTGGGGQAVKTETAITASVALTGGGGQMTKTETAITATVVLASGSFP